jgi:hypothetical protein
VIGLARRALSWNRDSASRRRFRYGADAVSGKDAGHQGVLLISAAGALGAGGF